MTNYSHFCPHFRATPGRPCSQCNLCDLWKCDDSPIVLAAAHEGIVLHEGFFRGGEAEGPSWGVGGSELECELDPFTCGLRAEQRISCIVLYTLCNFAVLF